MKDRTYAIGTSIGKGDDRINTIKLSEIVDLKVDLTEAEIDEALYNYFNQCQFDYIESWFEEAA